MYYILFPGSLLTKSIHESLFEPVILIDQQTRKSVFIRGICYSLPGISTFNLVHIYGVIIMSLKCLIISEPEILCKIKRIGLHAEPGKEFGCIFRLLDLVIHICQSILKTHLSLGEIINCGRYFQPELLRLEKCHHDPCTG